MIRLALGGGKNVLERGFKQGKSGGQKNGHLNRENLEARRMAWRLLQWPGSK